MRFAVYVAFIAREAAPLLLIAFWTARKRRLGHMTLTVVAAMLVLPTLGQIGFVSDFMMRVSIAPLALLALMAADAVMEVTRPRRTLALAVLGVGAVTGWHELRRALTLPPSPPPLCSFYGAWGRSPPAAKSTYLAAVDALPGFTRPAQVTLVPKTDPPRCWAGDWPIPSGA